MKKDFCYGAKFWYKGVGMETEGLSFTTHGERVQSDRVLFRKPIFVFDDYQEYLRDLLEVHGRLRGLKTQIARAANCQPSYLSQVMRDEAHFSLDQLFGVSVYLGFGESEWEYLKELWVKSRAATPQLRAKCQQNLLSLKKKVGGDVGAAEFSGDTMRVDGFHLFGTSWHHGAFFVALEIPELRTPAALEKRFRISKERVDTVLRELKEMGLAVEKNGTWTQTSRNFVMDRNSPVLQMYRFHWFLKGQQNFGDGQRDGYLAGASFALSREKLKEIQRRARELIHELFLDTGKGKPEVVAYFGIDLFEI